ncbi:hypothetical protein CDN99_00985 [Roseateles aquatilis]|uniref:DUF4350 domain-containing protein n=1 Tax=Roseateles aquatilis TaxID=431061 RepID=A0A246JLN4_9BURK|nr:DUF4350 domain-containing protein [Roseateles aquatilis]OWQ93109.1 hypothetical protein CDN99_00985 [Roseateles aquatilis]
MNRDRVIWALVLLVSVLGGWWFSTQTEWVERERPRRSQGEALKNPVYAFEQVLRRLGLQAQHREELDALPPKHARLVLLSGNWTLMPGRAEQLHRWVERGGHLVLVEGFDWDDTKLEDWVPVQRVPVGERVRREAAEAASAASAAERARAPAVTPAAGGPDREGERMTSNPPIFGNVGKLELCSSFRWSQRLRTKPGHEATWTLEQKLGAQGLRVSVGQGSVTVLNTSRMLFHNDWALRCDAPVLLAAAVQAEPGAEVWIYLGEQREALLPWLWHSGWIAILFGALALAAALWRGAIRFGPRLAPPPRLRRSISEQVRGMGAYLHREGGDALLAAQQRALDEAASNTLPGYGRLTRLERAHAIADATLVARDDLATAMSSRLCTRAELPPRLHLLESARRRLQRPHEERHSP